MKKLNLRCKYTGIFTIMQIYFAKILAKYCFLTFCALSLGKPKPLNMAHSPAPWKWDDPFFRGPESLVDSTGNEILHFGEIMAGGEWLSGREPSPADAALIAAAPEMYNALVRAYFSTSKTINCGIEEAIAKAEGMSAFVNWFIARKHLNEWGGACDVNIPTPNGIIRLTPKQINEGAERWEQAIAKAEGL